MFNLFKKPTKEALMQKRANDVLTLLFNHVDAEFTEMETVQVLNMVRRKANEHLENLKSDAMEQSVNFNQKAKEISEAIKFIE